LDSEKSVSIHEYVTNDDRGDPITDHDKIIAIKKHVKLLTEKCKSRPKFYPKQNKLRFPRVL
jgi:septation ring formation regulator EzrA